MVKKRDDLHFSNQRRGLGGGGARARVSSAATSRWACCINVKDRIIQDLPPARRGHVVGGVNFELQQASQANSFSSHLSGKVGVVELVLHDAPCVVLVREAPEGLVGLRDGGRQDWRVCRGFARDKALIDKGDEGLVAAGLVPVVFDRTVPPAKKQDGI